RARELATVDEERRSAVRAELTRELLVLRDGVVDARRVAVGLPLLDVEADLLRVLLERGLVEVLLVVEHLVVHLPVLALGAGRDRGGGGRLRERVEGERV